MDREKWAHSFGIGLTGGIATGKSTVASILRSMGVLVWDADALAREVVGPGREALSAIVGAFGPEFLLPSGELDRAKVRKNILLDAQLRKKLEGILHPVIQKQLWFELEKAGIVGTATFWVYEAALLFESNTHERFLEIWVTNCSIETQLSRLCQRDRLSIEQATQLLEIQGPTEDKCRRATRIIDTEGSLPSIREQVFLLWDRVISRNI
jgi:dephospho-CoA kinase